MYVCIFICKYDLSLVNSFSLFVLFELFNDVNVFISSHEEFNHDLVTIRIIDLALAQPVIGVIFQEILEDLAIVRVLDEQTNCVVIELLGGNISLEFLAHFFDGIGFGLGIVVDR